MERIYFVISRITFTGTPCRGWWWILGWIWTRIRRECFTVFLAYFWKGKYNVFLWLVFLSEDVEACKLPEGMSFCSLSRKRGFLDIEKVITEQKNKSELLRFSFQNCFSFAMGVERKCGFQSNKFSIYVHTTMYNQLHLAKLYFYCQWIDDKRNKTNSI